MIYNIYMFYKNIVAKILLHIVGIHRPTTQIYVQYYTSHIVKYSENTFSSITTARQAMLNTNQQQSTASYEVSSVYKCIM